MRSTTTRPGVRAAVTAVAVATCVALLLGLSVLAASLLGAPTPAEDLPTLPDGYALGAPESGCGSGGCFLVADASGPPGVPGDEVAESLRATVTGCRANGWIDRRRLCTSVVRSVEGQVQVAVMLHELGR